MTLEPFGYGIFDRHRFDRINPQEFSLLKLDAWPPTRYL
ncbi:unnamed protein product [Tenebrio molitor]|nr:unnamed protein product [Tenebrio molitor]